MVLALKRKDLARAEITPRVAEAASMLALVTCLPGVDTSAGKLLTRRPSQLSGGQRQRVAIGRRDSCA
jgi:ABC-type sugar transport system ATPase subunit